MAPSSFHYEPLGIDLKLGKLPATDQKPKLSVDYADIAKHVDRSAIPPLPKSWGLGGEFPKLGWGMLGNGPASAGSNLPPNSAAFLYGCGDCFWAMLYHRLRAQAKAAGRPVPPFSDLTVVWKYEGYTMTAFGDGGYQLMTGQNDSGTNPVQAYDWLETNPITDDNGVQYPMGLTINGTPGDLQQTWEMAYLFEGAGVGLALQQAQEDQTNAGKPWSYVPGSPIIGGHEVLVYRTGLVSWGQLIPWSHAPATSLLKLNDETQASLTPEMYNARTGRNVDNLADADLELFAKSFTPIP